MKSKQEFLFEKIDNLFQYESVRSPERIKEYAARI